jgi:hypothetical protein
MKVVQAKGDGSALAKDRSNEVRGDRFDSATPHVDRD